MTVIDCFTKYAWGVAVKSKSEAKDMTRAMSTVFSARQPPKNQQTDKGREFYNTEFRRLMEKYGVNHYSTQSNLKANIV
jgi:transposase InsO family protein